MYNTLKNIKNESGIYEILNIKNNKRYIGQSIHLKTRLLKHINYLDKNQHQNKHLQNSWNKYGKALFKVNVLEYCSIEELDKKEDYYISIYNSNDSNFGFNHRIDNKTNRGLKWSEEQRVKMQQHINKKDSYYKNHTIPKEIMEKAWEASRNRVWSKEDRERHSKILKGTTVSNTSKMKLAQQGSKNPTSKLTEDEVKEIICLCQSKYCEHNEIAKVYNVSLSSIDSISANRTWKHIDRNNIDSQSYYKGVDKVNEYIKSNQRKTEIK